MPRDTLSFELGRRWTRALFVVCVLTGTPTLAQLSDEDGAPSGVSPGRGSVWSQIALGDPEPNPPVSDSVARAFVVYTGATSAISATDAVSRGFMLYASATGPILPSDSVSREFFLFVGQTGSIAQSDSVSREFSLFVGSSGHIAPGDAVSREFSLYVPGPDLVAVSVDTVKSEISEGVQIEVSWTVRNDGDAPASEPRTDTVALSLDDESGGDTVIGSFVVGDVIEPGASVEVTRTVTVPPGVSGERWVVVTVNDGREIDESDYSNNAGVSSSPITVLRPDLRVASWSVPEQAPITGEVTVAWTVVNDGPGDAPPLWVDRVVASTTPMSGPGDIVLHTEPGPVGGLAAGSSYAREVTAVIPGSVPPGEYFVFIITDALGQQPESDEGNNATPPVPVQALPPDLPDFVAQVQPLGFSSVNAGESVSLSYRVQNSGTQPGAGAWNDAVFLSETPALGAGAVRLSTLPANAAPLGAGVFYERTVSVVVPQTFEGGQRYLIVRADDGNAVSEIAVSNNVSASMEFEVLATPAPDLRPLPVGVATEALVFGEAVRVDWRGENIGDAPATGSWSDGVFLSVDQQVNAGDRLLGTVQRSASPLEQGDPPYDAFLEASLPLDNQTVEGEYFMLVRVDTNNAVTESDEANNTLAYGPFMITRPPLPDLVVLDVDAPSAAAPGDSVLVTWRLRNDGPVAAPAPHTTRIEAVGLSGPGSSVVGVVPVDSVVEPGMEVEQSAMVVVPAFNADGLRFRVCADVGAAVVEAIKDNNCTESEPVEYLRPDLVAVAFMAPAEVIADETVSIAFPVENAGEAVTQPIWSDALYLSIDDQPGNDILIGTRARMAPVAPGGSYLASVDAVIPSNLQGSYYLIAETDRGDRVRESGDASNNFAVSTSQVTIVQPPRPDLVVTQIGALSGGLSGQPVEVTWSITNQGEVPVNGPWVDRVYAVREAGLTDSAFLIGEFALNGPVQPGETVSFTRMGHYPLTAGAYRVGVVTDATNLVNEGLDGGEENNVEIGAGEFTVGGVVATVQANFDDAPADTDVHLSGMAIAEASGLPAPSVPIAVRISNRGFVRTLSTVTDGDGMINLVFDPAPTEAGAYSVGAGTPDDSEAPVTDTFNLWGLGTTPASAGVIAYPGLPRTGQFTLRNVGDLPVSGITLTVENGPSELVFDASPPFGLGELESVVVPYSLTAAAGTEGAYAIKLKFASDQGAMGAFTLNTTVAPPIPVLALVTDGLAGGRVVADMIRGQSTYKEFRVRNTGGAPTGPLTVELPEAAWLSVAEPLPLDSIDPGGEAAVVIRLSPAADLALGPYTGTLIVGGAESALAVPFTFVSSSAATGSLLVNATDEFTYWGDGALVSGASVELRSIVDGSLIASAITGADGAALIPGVPEAYYSLSVRAEDHDPFKGTVLVGGGTGSDSSVTNFEAFMHRQVVRYVWDVTPIDLEDSYQIEINAEFTTNVPAPVVVIEPAHVDLASLTAAVTQIDFTVTNYGLVTAQDALMDVPDRIGPFRLIPLITEIGDLPGGCGASECESGAPCGPCRVTVPVLFVRDIEPRGDDPDSACCYSGIVRVCYDCTCGLNIFNVCRPAWLTNRSCCPTGVAGWPPADTTVYMPAPTSFPLLTPFGFIQYSTACNAVANCGLPCGRALAGCPKRLGAAVGCLGAAYDCASEIPGFDQAAPLSQAQTVVNCVWGLPADCLLPILGGAKAAAYTCVCTVLRDCAGCTVLGQPPTACQFLPCTVGDVGKWTVCGAGAMRSLADRLRTSLQGNRAAGAADVLSDYDHLLVLYFANFGLIETAQYITGRDMWLQIETPLDASRMLTYMYEFGVAIAESSDSGAELTEAEMNDLASLPQPDGVTPELLMQSMSRWNSSVELWNGGVRDHEDVTDSEFPHILVAGTVKDLLDLYVLSNQYSVEVGFESSLQALYFALDGAFATYDDALAEGICASVRIQIDQELTLTRSAFEASLLVSNDSTQSLEALSVSLVIRNELGESVNHLFGVTDPMLTGVGAIDGSQPLAPGQGAAITWTIVPSDEAAPFETTVYTVSGTLGYVYNGEPVSVPLFPAPIYVLPNPQLELRYFLETEVYANDPFTPEVEPSVPFSLGLMANNFGVGEAQDLRIASAQPRIVENELGLVIDFDIVGTQVGLQQVSPSLTMNLGDLPGGETAVGRWLLLSSLQGRFTSFEAEYTHNSPFNRPELSIIKSVDIFALDHVVLADEPPEGDDLPDFLTNEFPDPERLPDRVHLSDGSIHPVVARTDASVSTEPGELKAIVTLAMPDAWTYIRIDDPFGGAYRLTSVERGDGKPIVLGYNAWQTDRIVRLVGQPEEAQRRLHLFDRGGSGVYHLTFDPDSVSPRALRWTALAEHDSGLGEVPLALAKTGVASESRLGVSRLMVEFDEPVSPASFEDASVLVVGRGPGGVAVPVESEISVELRSGERVGIITFEPPLTDRASYCVELVNVQDRAGNPLSGSDSRFRFVALAGDATGDRRVNNTDIGGVLSLLGTDPIDPSNILHVRSDINRDGRIDMPDVGLIVQNHSIDLRNVSDPCMTPPSDSGGEGSGSPVRQPENWIPEWGELVDAGTPAQDGALVPLAEFSRIGPSSKAVGPHVASEAQVGTGERSATTSEPGMLAIRVLREDPVSEALLKEFDQVASIHPGPGETQTAWWIVTVDAANLASLEVIRERAVVAGLYSSPVYSDTSVGRYAVGPTVEITTLANIPREWMDRVLALAPVTSISMTAIRSDDLALRLKATLRAHTAEQVLAAVEWLAARREIKRVELARVAISDQQGDVVRNVADPQLIGDLDGDGAITMSDLKLLLPQFGTESSPSDLDGDGTVSVTDFLRLLEAIGAEAQ